MPRRIRRAKGAAADAAKARVGAKRARELAELAEPDSIARRTLERRAERLDAAAADLEQVAERARAEKERDPGARPVRVLTPGEVRLRPPERF